MRAATKALLLAGIVGVTAVHAHAAVIAYDNAVTTQTLQNYGGSLGLDFTVNSSITITALGAFDNGVTANLAGHDGRSGVTVAIYSVASGLQVGDSVTFTPTNAGTQINGDAFLPVGSLTLTSGTYSIVAFNDVNYNSYGTTNSTSTTNSGGGSITFAGTARYSGNQSSISFPTTIDSGPANRYDAGTFAFDVPEPASLALLGVSIAGAGLIRRRRQPRG